MDEVDLVAEARADALAEAREEEYIERMMRTDFDYALERLSIDEDSTIKEMLDAVKELESYGWEISPAEMLDYI